MTPAPSPSPDYSATPEASAAAALRQRLNERDDLLALVAHELRNPLHALSLQVSVARMTAEGQGCSDVAARIAKAQDTLQRYVHRVTVLLDLLAHEGGTYPAARQQVDIGQAIAAIVEGLRPEAQYRHVEVLFTPPAEPCHALLDTLALEQIIDNLMLNAFKHAACTQVVVTLRCDNDWADIAVSDNGRGIEENDRERVFHKSMVAQASARGSGTGLGLWIVRRLSLVLGGHVTLASAPGQGCTFTLRIPLAKPLDLT